MATAFPVDENEKEDLPMFYLIWLDSSSSDDRHTEEKLRSIINQLETFQDLSKCIKHIKQTSNKDQLILVVSGRLGKQILPLINHMDQVISVYVFCFDKEANEQWSSEYSKVKGVLTDTDELVSKIKQDHFIDKQSEETLPMNIFVGGQSTNELNVKFVFFQVFLECLSKLEATVEDKTELIQLLKDHHKKSPAEIKNIKCFEKDYLPDKALWWYTRQCFFYPTLNSVLRTENIHWIYLYRSYIFDIQRQLKFNQIKEIVKVYRGQKVSKRELDSLKKSINQFISINSFFSTSTNQSQALAFLNTSNPDEHFEKVLFEIEANPNVGKTKPFADISQLSYFPREEEILFTIGSIFRIKTIFYDHIEHYWTIQMNLSSNEDNQLKQVLDYMKRKMDNKQTDLRLLANILSDMKMFDLAQKYLERMLNQPTLDDYLRIDLYENLGKVALQMGDIDKSNQYFHKLNRFIEQNPSASLLILQVNLDNLIQINKDDIELYEDIGSGAFGTVHRAKWLTSDMIVAVKKLHLSQLNKDAEKNLLNELSFLNRIRHPNIIVFYGACIEKDHYALIMEYISLGSLHQLLHQTKMQLSWPHRISIASQAAKGINYLHLFQPPILHRDIKSLNLLLENHQSGYLVKICDFGMAKTRHDTTCQTKGNTPVAFTLPWTAPEVLRMKPHTTKSDIYSLGIVYWELANYEIPYDGHGADNIRQFVLAGDRLDISDDTPSNFRHIIEKCWAQKPEDRPTSVNLLKMLNECIQNSDQNYSNLFFKQNATTIAPTNGQGRNLNQLNWPIGIHVDDQQQSIYVADKNNHRIVKWKFGENNGQLIAGGNGQGNRIDQLNQPTDVIVDQNNKSLIICDFGNRRVVRWSLENQQDKQIIIQNIDCSRLMMNDNGDLFVSDREKHEVKRWRKGEKEGTVVAGGNGQGNQLNQLNVPTFIFIDRQDAVYVSDRDNDRVMKWVKGAKEGIVVAGGQGQGNSFKQLSYPQGLIVNEVGDVYVADYENHRIMCWSSGSKEGRLVVGGNGRGQGSNQFNGPFGLSFDGLNNLYVADCHNHRIQRFSVDKKKK